MIKYILVLIFLFSPTAFAEFNKADVDNFIEYMHNKYSYNCLLYTSDAADE